MKRALHVALALTFATPAFAARSRRPKAAPTPAPATSTILEEGARTPAPAGSPASDAGLDPIAIVGGTVWTMDGLPIESGTVLFRDGKIVEVGRDIEIPGKARRIDATGKIVTPGLVDASTFLGLSEIDQVTPTADYQVAETATAIHGAFRVVDGLNPESVSIPVARMEGVTSAIARPEFGLVSGQGAWIHLDGRRTEDMVVEAPIALWAALDEGAKEFAGNSRSAALRRLREAFDDSRLLRTREIQLDENRLRALVASRADLEALWPVIDRKIPLVVRAQKASDIQNALRFARDQKIRVVIEGGAEAWKVADELAAAKVPVLIKAMTDLPSSFESLGARFDNAALLEAAGVTFALVTGDTRNVRTLRQEAGNASAWGLPKDRALYAITRAPAEIFAVAPRLGTLSKGKIADVVIWSGDPLELSTQPLGVWINGKEIPRRSRQTDLLDRYRTLPPTH